MVNYDDAETKGGDDDDDEVMVENDQVAVDRRRRATTRDDDDDDDGYITRDGVTQRINRVRDSLQALARARARCRTRVKCLVASASSASTTVGHASLTLAPWRTICMRSCLRYRVNPREIYA